MPLESCMILLDNSQFMRNGDYIPSRLAAQQDAANLLVSHKTQSNPESTVGIIAMNGGCFTSGVELLVSPTDDVGKILGALHGIPVRGSGELKSGVDIPASVQVASLALKHRRNKNGQQRIVIFVGSPLTEVDKKTMVKAGKTLKKNNVKIDIVAMGELEENEEKLMDLVNAANGSNTSGEEAMCHLVTIPAGTLPSDILISSPIIHGGEAHAHMGMGGGAAGASAGGGGGDDFAEYGGIDPNLDPELAMALRISMEEERTRQERIARESQQANADTEAAAGGEEGGDASAAAKVTNADVKMEEVPSVAVPPVDMGDEDAMLKQALALSMAEAEAAQPKEEDNAAPAEADMEEDDEDDAAMQMALEMSMADGDAPPSSGDASAPQHFQDPQFVNQLLGSLPGVDPTDPSIKEALEQLNKSGDAKKDGDDKKDDAKK